MPNCTIIDIRPDYVGVAVVENGKPLPTSTFFSPDLTNFKRHIKAHYDMDWPNKFVQQNAIVRIDEDDSSSVQYEFGELFYTTILPYIEEFLQKLENAPPSTIIRGELSLVPGLVTRLIKDLSVKFVEKNFSFTHDPENCVWDILKGGKIMSNLSDFKEKCQKRGNYEQVCHPSQYATFDQLSQKIKQSNNK